MVYRENEYSPRNPAINIVIFPIKISFNQINKYLLIPE